MRLRPLSIRALVRDIKPPHIHSYSASRLISSAMPFPVQSVEKQLNRATYDFRSDTVTTPTEKMLRSMTETSQGDAVYDEDEVTSSFEKHVAELLGHEAGLFVPSGTAGNQIAFRCHLKQPPHSILADSRSHAIVYEAGGMAMLSQAMAQPVIPRNGLHLTLEDIKKAIVLDEDIHNAPTRVISLENTLGGTIFPLNEIMRIRQFALSNNVKMHLDGARLWNAAAAGAGTLKEYGQQFDSVSLCFSKGLGAPVGTVLVGSFELINRGKWVRKSIGGGMRQTGSLAAAAWTALEEVYPKLPATHAIAQDLERHFLILGLRMSLPVQTNMIFLDLEAAGLESDWLVTEAAKRGLKLGGIGRIVVHHQICDDAVQALKAAVETTVTKAASGELVKPPGDKSQSTYGKMAH